MMKELVTDTVMESDIAAFREARLSENHDTAAQFVALMLGPRLEYVDLLTFMINRNWRRYKVIRDSHGAFVDTIFHSTFRPS